MELKVELESGRSRGFAYVTFETHDAMSSACELLNAVSYTHLTLPTILRV